MRLIFFGGVFYPEMMDEIIADSKIMPDMAADALQWKIIRGFEKNLNSAVSVLNAPYIASYPQSYRKPFFSHRVDSGDNCSVRISIPFVNLFAARNLSIHHGLIRAVDRAIQEFDPDETLIAVVYALHSPWLEAAEYLKKIHPNCKTCYIVTDIPEYMNLQAQKGFLYRALKKIDRRKIQNCIDCCDSFVLLTESMKLPLKIGEKPYVVVEGMTDSETETQGQAAENSGILKKTAVYTGTLNFAYGIKYLLDAMKYIKDPEVRLVICGSGEAKDYLEQLAAVDRRIDYRGVLSPAETYRLQRQATVLINPRNNSGEFTKYSFPSKTLEYLSSGRPTVIYKLDGVPDDYDPYVFYIRQNTPKSIAEALEEVLAKSSQELDSFGMKARKFVLSRKNNVVQTGRILEMVERL